MMDPQRSVFLTAGRWFFRLTVVAALGIACAGGDDADSSTNWFSRCTSGDECSDGLDCLCGVCTAPCTVDDDCNLDAPSVTCRMPGPESSCGLTAGRGYCVASCNVDGSCAAGLSCIEGSCRPPLDAGTPDGGLQTPPDASVTDAGVPPRDASADSAEAGSSEPDLGTCALTSESVDVTVCETAVRCADLVIETLCAGPPVSAEPTPEELWTCQCIVAGNEQPTDRVGRAQGAGACDRAIEDCIGRYANVNLIVEAGLCTLPGPPPGCDPWPSNPYGGPFGFEVTFDEYPCGYMGIGQADECEEYTLCRIDCTVDADCPTVDGSDAVPRCDAGCHLSCDETTTCPPGMACVDRLSHGALECVWVTDTECPLCAENPGCKP